MRKWRENESTEGRHLQKADFHLQGTDSIGGLRRQRARRNETSWLPSQICDPGSVGAHYPENKKHQSLSTQESFSQLSAFNKSCSIVLLASYSRILVYRREKNTEFGEELIQFFLAVSKSFYSEFCVCFPELVNTVHKHVEMATTFFLLFPTWGKFSRSPFSRLSLQI